MNPALGDRVAYEDMANPLTTGTVTAVATACLRQPRFRGAQALAPALIPLHLEYEVTWDDGGSAWSDLRQRGWRSAR